MSKAKAPTIFNIRHQDDLIRWDGHTLDLTGSAITAQLTTDAFNLYSETGALKAIGNSYESFGIIVNTQLLEQAGYTLADITDFESLKTVCEDITARSAALGFCAFTSSGLDRSSSARFSQQLASLPLHYEGITTCVPAITGEKLDLYRNVWDLYLANSSADPLTLPISTAEDAAAMFREGKAVFWQNGTWEYDPLIQAGMTDDQLAMIPIYCGAEGEENTALCSGTQYHWAVNAKVSSTARQASLDFLEWLVTDPEATTIYSRQAGAVPFQNAPPSPNKFILDGIELLAAGKAPVSWAFQYAPNTEFWSATVATGLAAYAADPTDDTWQQVVGAFVDGWAYEYTMVNN